MTDFAWTLGIAFALYCGLWTVILYAWRITSASSQPTERPACSCGRCDHGDCLRCRRRPGETRIFGARQRSDSSRGDW